MPGNKPVIKEGIYTSDFLSLLSQEQYEGTVNDASLWYKYFDRIYFDTINFNSSGWF